jgi:RNA polymerase sigma-70 factor (ECF subfamily)
MPTTSGGSSSPSFQTTHWSLVLLAAERGAAGSDDAIAKLCGDYWQPLYGYVRRCGESVHAAQDLTQEFFARLLDKNYLQTADRERGRFRSFLLGALKHFLANERKAARAQKRGGGQPVLSLDFQSAEAAYLAEPVDERTPDQVFAQQWAVLLLDRVLNRLEEEFSRAGKVPQFQQYRTILVAGDGQRSYEAIAAELGMTEAAVKMSVHRLRKRYRALLREEIAQTVANPADVDEEMRELFAVLSPP